jgi:urease accessory protein
MALFELLTWMSPAFPVGAFAHSSGLEWAVETGDVRDRASAEAWIRDSLEIGAARTDALLFAATWRAVRARAYAQVREIAELACAAQTCLERRVETTAQGAAFRKIARAAADCPELGLLDHVSDADLAYPVAAGCLMAGHGVALADGLVAFLHGVMANQVSAAQRLTPLGQTDGQLILAALRAPVLMLAAEMVEMDLSDPFAAMGGSALVAEIACMAHETQYTRLFRT